MNFPYIRTYIHNDFPFCRAIVKELIAYAFFIMIAFIISYGNRDPLSFLYKQQLEQNFILKYGFEEVVQNKR